MTVLAQPSLPVLAALLGVGVAIAAPRPMVSAAATLLVATALGLHLPALGVGAVGLSIAAALSALATVQPLKFARGLQALAWLWLLTALPEAAEPPMLPIHDHVAAALACVVLMGSVAAAVQWADTPLRRLALALLAVALPLGPAGGSLLRWQTAVALPHDGVASSWLASGSFVVAAQQSAPWIARLPLVAQILALAGLGVALARQLGHRHDSTHDLPSRRSPVAWLPVALLLAAGQAGIAAAYVAVQNHTVHVPGSLLPQPLPLDAQLDPGLLLAWLARILTAAGLLLTQRPRDPVPRGPALAHGLTLGAGLGILLVWLVFATAWHGAAWPADPAVFSLAACLVAAAGALPSLWLGKGPARDLAQVLQLTAALWLVGGADAGWRVAGALLG